MSDTEPQTAGGKVLPDSLSGGKGRLAILSPSLTDELLSQPCDDFGDMEMEPDGQGGGAFFPSTPQGWLKVR